MTAAVFVDRDGVIIRNRGDYVKSLAETEYLPGAVWSLARLSRAGHPVLVVTNQSAIDRGLVSAQVVDQIHQGIATAVAAMGGRVDAFLVCPHRPDAGCDCRKPRAGLLLEASRRFEIDLSTAYMIGDQVADLEAGLAAGCRPILVRSAFAKQDDAASRGVPYCDDLTAAAELILSDGGSRAAA